MNLTQKKCVPCEGGTPPLTPEEAATYLAELKTSWLNDGNKKIRREFKFSAKGGSLPDRQAGASGGKSPFMEAMAFVNKVADLAESEGHHPDIHIFYNKVVIELWTHAAGGLTENDFIVASKIETLVMR